jgi:hypothetical protein
MRFNALMAFTGEAIFVAIEPPKPNIGFGSSGWKPSGKNSRSYAYSRKQIGHSAPPLAARLRPEGSYLPRQSEHLCYDLRISVMCHRTPLGSLR